ncbi:MAG: hypothetical protein KME43_24665 [Myxacorys chilensis ATA2-1-KO14]|jgi:putative transposase|nr:hypothetical protein [Myxacorys chilensis ATA2-1-KO14]
MTPASPSSLSALLALTDAATLSATLDCLVEHLTIPPQGDCTAATLFQILIRAASQQVSIEHTTQQLTGVPTGNTIRYHLDNLDNMAALEAQLNQALQSRVPSWIRGGKQRLAIDLHLIPYYGTPTATELPYIYGSQAKSGTTSFFADATVYVVARNKRVTLAIHAIHRQETLVATLTYLLAALSRLRLRVKRLYLDRDFFCVPVIRAPQSAESSVCYACPHSRQARRDLFLTQRAQKLHDTLYAEWFAWSSELHDGHRLPLSSRQSGTTGNSASAFVSRQLLKGLPSFW